MDPHWLREYEGPRGVAYLLGLVGSIAPSAVALFWLDPKLFGELDSARVILLCLSVGGITTALSVIGFSFAVLPSPDVETDPGVRSKAMTLGLVMGSGNAFVMQCISLGITTWNNWSFHHYISLAVFISILGVASVWITQAWDRRWGNK